MERENLAKFQVIFEKKVSKRVIPVNDKKLLALYSIAK
jgi:hypothetical protein